MKLYPLAPLPPSSISLPPPLSPSAITWNQRSRGASPHSAAPVPLPSAFSSPKHLKRGVARLLKRSPGVGGGAPHNSPLRGAALQDGSALMIVEEDILSASMALTGVGAIQRLPKVVYDMSSMCGEADGELAVLLEEGECDDGEDGNSMCSGRANPVLQQLRATDVQRFHAQRPSDALYVQAKRM